MIQSGYWIGHYMFDKKVHQEMNGFDHTNFEIEITYIENDNFFGKVQDDLTTGGTQGIGLIEGTVSGNKVKFVKQMPVMTLLVDKKGKRKTLNRRHPKIYYSGTFSSDGKSISGQWRYKFGFVWFTIIPIPIIPAKGTWTMKFKNTNERATVCL